MVNVTQIFSNVARYFHWHPHTYSAAGGGDVNDAPCVTMSVWSYHSDMITGAVTPMCSPHADNVIKWG